MKVSGSVLATKGDYIEYANELKKANIDYLHIDIFQNNDSFSLNDLVKFKDLSIPLDVHLIFEDITNADIDILNDVKVEILNVQYENLKEKKNILDIARLFNGKFGLALTANTSLDVVDENIELLSQVLIMCSVPGVSGAKFNEDNYQRVEELHRKYPSLCLMIDGGVNASIGGTMGELGAEILISGSYLCKDILQLTKNGYFLKYLNESNINVKRNMISYNELPIVSKEEVFMNIILKMSEYRLGVVLVAENQQLLGIIADGDVRRNLLLYGDGIFAKKASDLMNKNPFVVNEKMFVEDVYAKLFNEHKGIEVVPIIDGQKLIGVLDLHMGK